MPNPVAAVAAGLTAAGAAVATCLRKKQKKPSEQDAPPPADSYTPMPEAVMAELIATRERLLSEMAAAGARWRAGAAGTAVAPPPPGGSLFPVPAEPGKVYAAEDLPQGLTCPVMTEEEVAAITVDMSVVLEDGGAALRRVMGEYGVCIVGNAMSPAEVALLEELWKEELAALSSDARDRAEVYHPQVKAALEKLKAEGPKAFANAIVHARFGMFQGACAWAARLHPNVRHVYAQLHGAAEGDLVVGMDHVFYDASPAAERIDEGVYWIHTDYSTRYPGFEDARRECYQGVLYCWSSERCGDGQATTVVWPRSHTALFDEVQAEEAAPPNHYFPHGLIKHRRAELKGRACQEARRVPVPAGGLLLWSGKTAHQGWSGSERLAVPVCWEPREFRDEYARRRKLWLAAAGMPSTHWASLGICHTQLRGYNTEIEFGTHPDEDVSHGVSLPLHPMLVPHTVAPAKLRDWQRAMPALWPRRATAADTADAFEDAAVVEALLRPEIVAAL
eukprot:TRINITY_DN4172_c0_g2_i2.p1 TRINITY_DN4172_c0_g2~~TRINITY_DN4172_c0_g2_i2.p1  ORF type:complete len:505 (+),score=186.44 TRINITY_DN4172_c0_g2_i2:72-1586(+)